MNVYFNGVLNSPLANFLSLIAVELGFAHHNSARIWFWKPSLLKSILFHYTLQDLNLCHLIKPQHFLPYIQGEVKRGWWESMWMCKISLPVWKKITKNKTEKKKKPESRAIFVTLRDQRQVCINGYNLHQIIFHLHPNVVTGSNARESPFDFKAVKLLKLIIHQVIECSV